VAHFQSAVFDFRREFEQSFSAMKPFTVRARARFSASARLRGNAPKGLKVT